MVTCWHPVLYEQDGWWVCARCRQPLRQMSGARPCGCLADPLVFGHVHN